MWRLVLLLILLGLAAGGVVVFLLGSDPPGGNGENAHAGQWQDRTEDEVAPMSGEDGTTAREQVPGAGVRRERLAAPVILTFRLSELVNHRSISAVSYKLLGPRGLRREVDGAKAPVTVSVQEPGEYVVSFQKPGFFPAELKFSIGPDSRDRRFDVTVRRAQGRVRVEVRDRASNQPITGFKVRVTQPTGRHGAAKWTGPIGDTHYDAFRDLDADGHLELQVEAPGYTPSEGKTVRVSALEPETELVFFLDRAAPFTGIELRVVESTLRPAKRVRVVAEIKQPDNTWLEMWNRQASRENGVYELPDLKPGSYRLTVRSVSPEGELDMHVPFVKEVEFAGGEKHQLPVQLEAGARILLRVTDQEGRLLGEGVQARLLTANGEPVRTVWEHIDEAGKPLPFVALGANGLVQDGRARLFDPVPPGRYSLQIRRPEGATHTIPITLAARETQVLETRL